MGSSKRLSAQVHPRTLSDLTSHSELIDLSDLIISHLNKIGIEYIFGIPGGAIEPLFNAVARSERKGGIKLVTARHETGAVFMADGYARETGKLGVCIATSGPGATNLITGLANAHENNIPILAITGQPALPYFGKRAFQEMSSTSIDIVSMLSHCTRYSSLISHPDQLEENLFSAIFRACHTPQGPSHLSIPVDILRSPVPANYQPTDLLNLIQNHRDIIDESAVQILKSEFAQFSSPIFFIGNHCADAIDSIMKLVEITNALFVTTPDAKGLINPRHQAYRGVFGFGGHRSAEQLFKGDQKLVVAFGTGFGEFSSNAWSNTILNTRLIHIDNNEENLMHTRMAKLHVRGRIRAVCERLAEILPRNNVHNISDICTDFCHPDITFHDPEQFNSDAMPIKPQRLMRELSLRCPPHTRFLADTGNSMVWTAHYLQPYNRRGTHSQLKNDHHTIERRSGTANWLRVTMDFATMGWAIGAAIGVARANPNNPVVCITGDGSFLMNGQEISVAVQEQLPIVFVILNDSAYGMVRHGQKQSGAEAIGYQLPLTDFGMLGLALGAQCHVILSPHDMQALDFAEMFKQSGPTIIDVRIDPDEAPPMTTRLKTLGSIK